MNKMEQRETMSSILYTAERDYWQDNRDKGCFGHVISAYLSVKECRNDWKNLDEVYVDWLPRAIRRYLTYYSIGRESIRKKQLETMMIAHSGELWDLFKEKEISYQKSNSEFNKLEKNILNYERIKLKQDLSDIKHTLTSEEYETIKIDSYRFLILNEELVEKFNDFKMETMKY